MSAIPPKATVRCAGHDDVGRGRRHRRDRAAAFTPQNALAATVPARPATCACDEPRIVATLAYKLWISSLLNRSSPDLNPRSERVHGGKILDSKAMASAALAKRRWPSGGRTPPFRFGMNSSADAP